jgi:amino acid transporter
MAKYFGFSFLFLYLIVVQFLIVNINAIRVFKQYRWKDKNNDYSNFVKALLTINAISIAYALIFFLVNVTGYNLLLGFIVALSNWGLMDYVSIMLGEKKPRKKKGI